MTGKPLAVLVVVAAGAAFAWWMSRDPAPLQIRADDGVPQIEQRLQPSDRNAPVPPDATRSVVVDVDPATGGLVRTDNLRAAGSRREVVVEPVERGIRCPDGRHLPLLNGVADAPPISRGVEQGPVPPVVAILVDRDGWDWYEHADGSITTSRPHVVVDAEGRRNVQVVTVHNAPGNGAVTEVPYESPPEVRDR